MRALIVYESMFGNTHEVANHIAEGLRSVYEVSIVRVGDATDEMIDAADLLLVGGPTHAHGLSRRRTREAANQMAAKVDNEFEMEPDSVGFGLRDWFHGLRNHDGKIAGAFDTRAPGPALFTGRASKQIAHSLSAHGFHVTATKSFVVTKYGHLAADELKKARAWGEMLGVVAQVRAEKAA